MAEDLIFKTLIQAGLRLDEADKERVRRQLAELGRELSDGVELSPLENQVKELRRLSVDFKKDRRLLQKASTGGIAALSPEEKRQLGRAFNSLKAYQDRLKKVTSTLTSLGDAAGEPLLRDLGSLNRVFAQLGAMSSKVAPMVDTITQSYKANVKEAQKLRKEEDIARSRSVRARKERRGRLAVDQAGGLEAPVTGFTNLASARKAQRYLAGELRDVTALQKTHADAFGATSDQAKRAGAEVNRYANYLNNLERRIEELGASSVRQNKIDAANQRIRDAEEKRRVESIRQDRGRQVFTQAAGDYKTINNPRDARKALSFVNSELRQLEVQQRETAKAAGAGSEQYKKATAEVTRYATAVAALQDRLEKLKARTPSRQATGSSALTDGRQVYQQARLLEGGFQALGAEEAKKAKQFVQARLAEVRARGKELGKLYGENSREALAAGNAAKRYASDLGVLTAAARPAGQNLNFLQTALRSFFKYAVAYQVLYSLGAAIGTLARNVAELQAELLEIQAVTGSTDAQMSQLGTTVVGVAKNSKFSLVELTKAAKVLAQAGVAVEDLNSTLNATANFAAATGSNLEIAADLLSTTRSVFKELSDTVIADQLAKAINVSKLTGEDLKTILSLGAQTAKSFNLTSEQFLAAVSVLRNAGLKASTVATGLRQGMLEIFSPDSNLIKALQERYRALGETMGSEAVRARFFAFTRDRAPLIAALTELRRLGFADEGAQTLSRAFDVRSSNAIKAMVRNLEEMSEVEGRITFGRGAAEGAATVIDGLNASFTRLNSTITGFTYSRSDGLLGFLTDLVQGADQAIQKLDKLDLERRARGEAPSSALEVYEETVGKFSPIPGIKPFPLVGRVTRAAQNFFSKFSPQTAEGANDQAYAKQTLLDQRKAEFAQFVDAAKEYDISAAQVGEAAGQTAQSLVTASRTADDLTVGLRDVFGNFGDQQDAIEELVKSYNGLSLTQRKARLEELKKKFPDSRLASLAFAEADRELSDLGKLRSEVSGALTGFAKDLNQKLVRSREIINKLKGGAPVTPEEVEAVIFEQLVSQSEDLQDILRSTSENAVNLQFGIIQQASQALSDQMRAKGEANPFESEARRQAEAFIARIKAISLSANQGTADADVRAAATALLAQFDKLDQASITHLQQIQSIAFDAASQLGSGQGQKLLLYAIGEIQKGVDSNATSILETTAERTQANKELIGPALQDPDFLKFLQAKPTRSVGQRRIEELAGPDSKGLPVEDVLGNTLDYQETLKAVQDYNDIQKRNNEIQTEVQDELGRRLGLERAATRATEAYDEARTNKKFGEAREALNAMFNAQVAVEAERLENAKREVNNFNASDPSKNKQAIERVLQAQNRIGELEERRAKDLEKLNREEAKVSLRREQSTLKGEQKRLRSVLDNASYLTPQEVLDDTIKLYDENNLKLLELFERRQKIEGELNDLSEEQIAEEKKKLRPFADTAEAQELRIRQEQGKLDNVLVQLSEEPSTGDVVTDARYRERGLVPGSREQRKAFLERRQETLQTALELGRENLQRNSDELKLLRARATEDLGNEEITQKLQNAIKYEESLINGARSWALELGDVSLALEKVNTRFQVGFQRAFDPQLIRAQLQQSQYSFEQFGDVINDQVVGGIESIGDAFADAALEGENFLDSMDKIFVETGKSILRTIIKTFSNEAIGGLLGGLPLFGPAIAKATGTDVPDQGAEPTQGLLGGLIGGLFGTKKKSGGGAPGVGGGDCCCDGPGAPGGKFGGLTKEEFFANDPTPVAVDYGDDEVYPGSKLLSATRPNDDPTGLKGVTETEGKGFFGTLTGWFGSLIDTVSGGFGKVFGSLKGLLFGGGGGKGGDSGLIGLATGLASAFSYTKTPYKGAQGFARGGVFRGKGSGTSDSIDTYLQGPNGERMPIKVSAGESLLTARATDMLGADFVHAANSGKLFSQSSGLADAQTRLTAAIPAAPAPGTSTEKVRVEETRNIQVAVSPAQMRMRMGDWLDQQLLDEVSRR